MKNVKISSLNENDLLELKTSKERISLFIDNSGISKDMIPFLNDVLKERPDFFLNISSEKDSGSNLSGEDIIKFIPEVRNLIFYASLKNPISNLNLFSRLGNLISLHINGNIDKDVALSPLDSIETLSSFYLENGFSLKHSVYIESRKSFCDIGASNIRVEHFTKMSQLKKLSILSSATHIDEIPKRMPNLEEIYIEKGKGINTLDFLNELKNLRVIELNSISELKYIPDLSKLENLEKVILRNLRSLEDLEPIFNNKK
ncbi:hypothetical protein, partial [Brachyspira pilosicoli]